MTKTANRYHLVLGWVLSQPHKKLFTAQQCADELGLCVRTIYRWIDYMREQSHAYLIADAGAGYIRVDRL